MGIGVEPAAGASGIVIERWRGYHREINNERRREDRPKKQSFRLWLVVLFVAGGGKGNNASFVMPVWLARGLKLNCRFATIIANT
jgi:hypothetical protein